MSFDVRVDTAMEVNYKVNIPPVFYIDFTHFLSVDAHIF